MADIVYEGMFILDSNRYGQDPGAVSGRIEKMIQGAGGEMLVSRLWEERRLAYPIKGHRRGTYWLTYFRLDSERLGDVTRQCQLNDSVLRELFLKLDPRIVDAMVAHAQTATPSSVPEEEKAKKDAPEDGDLDEKDSAEVIEDAEDDSSDS